MRGCTTLSGATGVMLLVLLLMALTTTAYSQGNPTINGDYSGDSHVILGEDYIRFKSEFQYQSEADNTLLATFGRYDIREEFGGYLGNEPGTFGIPMEDAAVGGTQTAFDVNQLGAANYSIPIMVSPGTNGIAPNIAIVYNHQGGDGPLGTGFGLAGLSAIKRVGATEHHDGVHDKVDFDGLDRLALDGERMVLKVGHAYGSPGSEYRLENNRRARIESIGTAAGPGAQYFKVWEKSGTIKTYGNSGDSRLMAGDAGVLTWALNKVEDRSGNFMTYHYLNNGNEQLISEIKYTGNDKTDAGTYSSVQFEYQARSHPRNYYLAGHELKVSNRLVAIKTYYGNQLLREYRLTYDIIDDIPQLTSVTEYNSVSEHYNPVQFQWNNLGARAFNAAEEELPITSSAPQAEVLERMNLPGDFTGDGRSEILSFFDISDGPTSGDVRNRDKAIRMLLSFENGQISGSEESPDPDPDSKKYVGDFNGDGLADYMAVSDSNVCKVYLSSGGDFELGFTQDMNLIQSFDWIQLGDIDGDGKTDLLAFEYFISNSGNTTFWVNVLYNDGERFIPDASTSPELTWISPEIHEGFQILVQDFDGDGRADIYVGLPAILEGESEPSIYLFLATDDRWNFDVRDQAGSAGVSTSIVNRNSMRADFNGDGLPDVLNVRTFSRLEPVDSPYCNDPDIKEAEGGNPEYQEECYEIKEYWRLSMGTGTGFETKLIPKPFTFSEEPDYYLGDFDGDGRSDVGIQEAGQLRLLRLKDLSEFVSITGILVPTGEDVLITDFNGNGISDVVVLPTAKLKVTTIPDCENRNCESYGITQVVNLYEDYVKAPAMVEGFANSYGSRVFVDYNPLTNPAVYEKGITELGPDLRHVQAPMYVVSAVSADNGRGRLADVLYHYKEALLHRGGRGFLGFLRREVEDLSQRTKTTETFELKTPHYVPVLASQQVESTVTGAVLSTNSISYVDLDEHVGSTFLYAKKEEISDSYDLYSGPSDAPIRSTTTLYDQYDPYGNAERIIVQYGDGHQVIIQNEYDEIDVSQWILGLLTKTTETSIAPGEDSHTSESTFTYYPDFSLESEIKQPEHELALTTTYAYDEYGNITHAATSGIADNEGNSQTRALTFGYDDKHRFVREQKNAKGHTTSKTFDPATGNVKTVTGPNGLTTSYDYDDFGKLERVVSPNQQAWTKTAYHWAAGEAPPSARYYIETTSSSGAPGRTYFDRLNREIRTEATGLWGKKVFVDKQYNSKGLVGRVSQPYFSDATARWSSFRYDPLGRVIEVSEPGNRVTSSIYTKLVTTSTDAKGHRSQARFNMLGQKIKSIDAENEELVYNYYSSGLLKSVANPQNNVTLFTYDALGNRTSVRDPDLGLISTRYNAFGELIYQTDEKGYETSFSYDHLGRMIEREIAKGSDKERTTWTFDTKKLGLLSKTSTGDILKEYFYDHLLRTTEVREVLAGGQYNTRYTYDEQDRITFIEYPSGLRVQQHFNEFGYLHEVSSPDGQTRYWSAMAENATGHLTHVRLARSINTYRDYDRSTGILKGIRTEGANDEMLQDESYRFDKVYNLTSRTNHLLDDGRGLTETFSYDALNRLKTTQIKDKEYGHVTLSYDVLGNIKSKSDVGNYGYDVENMTGRPHAVKMIELNGEAIPAVTQDIEYNGFDKVRSISEGDARIDFTYGVSHERKVTRTTIAGLTITKRFIGSLYEEEENAQGEVRKIHYIKARGEAVAIHVAEEGAEAIHYLLKDHLGSITGIVDDAGKVLERYSFDAWGKRRDADSWAPLSGTTAISHDRGFTGHEHLGLFGLINMNGRMYDPVIGRFLSPDPYTQSPDFTQGLNRYSYVFNNPLSSTDPSGYIALPFIALPTILKGIVITASPLAAVATTVAKAIAYSQLLALPATYAYLGSTSFVANGATAIPMPNGGVDMGSFNYNTRSFSHFEFDPSSDMILQGPDPLPTPREYPVQIDATSRSVPSLTGSAPGHIPSTLSQFANPTQTAATATSSTASSGWGFGLMDVVHGALDVAGLVPVLGEAFDLINAGIYAIEGDYTSAALSAAAAIPVLGTAATIGKLGHKAYRGYKAVKAARKTTTIIGRLSDTRMISNGLSNVKSGMNTGGYNILNMPNKYYTWANNQKWLQRAIKRGDIIKVASEPSPANLFRNGVDGIRTGFGKEVEMLQQAGYRYDPSTFSFKKRSFWK